MDGKVGLKQRAYSSENILSLALQEKSLKTSVNVYRLRIINT